MPETGGGYPEPGTQNNQYQYLRMVDGKQGIQFIRAPRGTRLGDLAKKVGDLTERTKWKPEQVLSHIMCGSFPAGTPEVTVQYDPSAPETLEVTITCRGPTTLNEVLSAYKRVLADNQLEPKGLTYTQVMVLYLVELMPEGEHTWEERYRTWLEWCEVDASLPTYGTYGATSLSKEFERAKQRSRWRRDD